MADIVLKLENITKTYQSAGESLTVLHGVDIELKKGEIVALMGPSGSGKSTLLHCIGLLDKPSTGKIWLDGKDVTTVDERTRTLLRRKHLGFVYQFHHLLAEFTAFENVEMPLKMNGLEGDVKVSLENLGLGHRLDHRPARLSGGEQQRVAIARALIHQPTLLLADEPTGNLDPETAEKVFDILLHAVREQGTAALIATHNPDLAARMDRILRLENGKVI